MGNKQQTPNNAQRHAAPHRNFQSEGQAEHQTQHTLSLQLLFLASSWGLAWGGFLGVPFPAQGLHPRQGLMVSSLAEVQEFVLVPLHSEPSHAAQEIDALYDVYTDVINKWGTNVSSIGQLGSSPGQPGGQVGGICPTRSLSYPSEEVPPQQSPGRELLEAFLPLLGACPCTLSHLRGLCSHPLRF